MFPMKGWTSIGRIYTGSRRFYSKITSDQPKDLLGLMSWAKDKGKCRGEGYVITVSGVAKGGGRTVRVTGGEE